MAEATIMEVDNLSVITEAVKAAFYIEPFCLFPAGSGQHVFPVDNVLKDGVNLLSSADARILLARVLIRSELDGAEHAPTIVRVAVAKEVAFGIGVFDRKAVKLIHACDAVV